MSEVTAQSTFELAGTWYAPGDSFVVGDDQAQSLFEYGYVHFGSSGLHAHADDTTNPHNVTAVQAGAVALADVEAGTATFSGDGATVVFSIAHGLGATPTGRAIWGESAGAAGDKYVSAASSTAIDVTFLAAPASGTNNVVIGYDARL